MVDAQELRLATLMRDLMVANAAPEEQFKRMGLPLYGPLTEEHLLCRTQAHLVDTSREKPLSAMDFPTARLDVTTPIADLRADPKPWRFCVTTWVSWPTRPCPRTCSTSDWSRLLGSRWVSSPRQPFMPSLTTSPRCERAVLLP